MKITVDFFNELNLEKILKNVFEVIKYGVIALLCALVISFGGTYLLDKKSINNVVLNIACNIRQAEKRDISKAEVLMMASNLTSPFEINTFKKDKEENHDKEVENVEKAEEENGFDVSLVDSEEVIAKKNNENLSIKETDQVQKVSIYGMTISNYSSKRDIDFSGLFKKNITLTKKSDPVLIYSTHTSESYTNSENYKFDYSSTYRTRDAKYNMLSVGNVLQLALKQDNFNVIFETTPHDYGSYEIAYTNSRKTVQNAISNNQRIGLSIDVHRDALGDLTQGVTTEINGQKVARLMFVMGVGTNSYTNEYWEDNLALALQIQKLGEEMYPGLFRGMIIRNSKYNQDLVKHSFLVEVGTTGNTLEEAYFGARCLANILNKFYNN